MKLSDFLDVADDDDMVEVYADDGATRPCELKLVDAFNVSDWVGGILDVRDELDVYLDREVTGVATVKLDGCGDDVVIAMRVYVEQKKGDEDVRNKGVRNVEEVQDETPDTDELGDDVIGFDLADRPVAACVAAEEFKSYSRSAMCEHLGFAYAILCDLVTLVGSSATDTVSEESVEALIRTAIDRVQRAGKAMGFKLGEGE